MGLKSVLGNVTAYIALQKVVGADRLRYRCLDELGLTGGETVLDVGCGPAYYLGRLPQVRYFGFDTSIRYIEWARRRWAGRGEFRAEVLREEHLAELPPADAILLLGLLHHLSDEESAQLLDVAAKALAPNGRVIAVDTCFEPSQGWISRWMSRNDRGEYVREPEAFVALARPWFGQVDGEILNDVTRIPSSFWMMRMSEPLVARPAGDLALTDRRPE